MYREQTTKERIPHALADICSRRSTADQAMGFWFLPEEGEEVWNVMAKRTDYDGVYGSLMAAARGKTDLWIRVMNAVHDINRGNTSRMTINDWIRREAKNAMIRAGVRRDEKADAAALLRTLGDWWVVDVLVATTEENAE